MMENKKVKCPVCDGEVMLQSDTEVSEVITCTECSTRLVVESLEEGSTVLSEAPQVEEDWGE